MIGLLIIATAAGANTEARFNRYEECINVALGVPTVGAMTPQALANTAEAACQTEMQSLLSIKGAKSGSAARLHEATQLLAAHKLSGKGNQPLRFSEVEEMMRANAQHQ